ncbi:hypothetical protein GQ457_18G019190 [Hibiscus cannabinus]
MGQIMLVLHGLKPAFLMLMVQVVFAGVNVLYKLAANDGMNLRIIVAYRFVFATAVMVPLALIVERKRPKLTWTILLQAFLCALLGGSLSQNMYIESLALTSATFVCAMSNLTPAITFIVAITIGLEKLALRTLPGKAKVLGTVTGLGGAMLLTFYKGIQFKISTHINLLPHGHHGFNSSDAAPSHYLEGALLAFACCICYALWLNIQTKMSEKYPCYYSSTALICVIGTVQTVVFALCMERDMSQWRLGWDIRLLTVAFSGIFGFGLTFSLISWCVRMRGPLYTSIFSPLVLILVAIAGSLFLEEKLYLGSILGAVLIVIGLYLVLWGKSKEMNKMTQLMPSSIISSENKAVEVVVASSLDDNILPFFLAILLHLSSLTLLFFSSLHLILIVQFGLLQRAVISMMDAARWIFIFFKDAGMTEVAEQKSDLRCNVTTKVQVFDEMPDDEIVVVNNEDSMQTEFSRTGNISDVNGAFGSKDVRLDETNVVTDCLENMETKLVDEFTKKIVADSDGA